MTRSILNSALYVRLIRWAFERFYREFAWTYDTVAALVSAGGWRSWALTARPFARGATLELGCGTGHVQLALSQRQASPAIGIDRSPQMLKLTRRRLTRAGLNATLVRADARALPFTSASFDSVIATFPSEYIIASSTTAEVRRVLRPGGTLAVALWARFDDDSPYARLVDLAYRLTLQRSPRTDPRAAAPASATPSRLGESLQNAGFAVSHEQARAQGGMVYYVVGKLG